MSALTLFWYHDIQDTNPVIMHIADVCCCSILLNFSWQKSQSYRNQSIDLQSKSVDWFLYDRDLRYERVKLIKKRKQEIVVLTVSAPVIGFIIAGSSSHLTNKIFRLGFRIFL